MYISFKLRFSHVFVIRIWSTILSPICDDRAAIRGCSDVHGIASSDL